MKMNRFSNKLKAIAAELEDCVMVLGRRRDSLASTVNYLCRDMTAREQEIYDALDEQIAAARECLESLETAVESMAAFCEEE